MLNIVGMEILSYIKYNMYIRTYGQNVQCKVLDV